MWHEKAQDLCYEAFDAIGRRQIQFARQALETSPDCADAWVLLAESTGEPEEARRLYAEGVAAGERALGKAYFEEDVGHFWGLFETRPYMRARFGLAQVLEALGRAEEAVEHYRELLRLNPGDNQGVRYLYLPCLMTLGHDAEAARYMQQYEDEPSAMWQYTRALLAYRLGGDSATARKELQHAARTNPYVLQLLRKDAASPQLPDSYEFGSPEEALICLDEIAPILDATPNAKDWLLHHGQPRRRPTKRRQKKRRKRKSR